MSFANQQKCQREQLLFNVRCFLLCRRLVFVVLLSTKAASSDINSSRPWRSHSESRAVSRRFRTCSRARNHFIAVRLSLTFSLSDKCSLYVSTVRSHVNSTESPPPPNFGEIINWGWRAVSARHRALPTSDFTDLENSSLIVLAPHIQNFHNFIKRPAKLPHGLPTKAILVVVFVGTRSRYGREQPPEVNICNSHIVSICAF